MKELGNSLNGWRQGSAIARLLPDRRDSGLQEAARYTRVVCYAQRSRRANTPCVWQRISECSPVSHALAQMDTTLEKRYTGREFMLRIQRMLKTSQPSAEPVRSHEHVEPSASWKLAGDEWAQCRSNVKTFFPL